MHLMAARDDKVHYGPITPEIPFTSHPIVQIVTDHMGLFRSSTQMIQEFELAKDVTSAFLEEALAELISDVAKEQLR